MSEQKNKAVVRINGSEYAFVSTDPEEYIMKVAAYVDRKMTALSQQDVKLSTALAAVLASVNIADEFFKAQEDADNLREQLLRYVEAAGESKKELDQLKKDNKELEKKVRQQELDLVKLREQIKQQPQSK